MVDQFAALVAFIAFARYVCGEERNRTVDAAIVLLLAAVMGCACILVVLRSIAWAYGPNGIL